MKPFPDQMAKLPINLLENLGQAITSLDLDQIQAAIDDVNSINPLLASRIKKLANEFDYDQLSKLIAETRSENTEKGDQ